MKSKALLLAAIFVSGELLKGHAAATGGAAAGGAAAGASSGAFGPASGSGTASSSGNAAVSGNASSSTAPSGNTINTTTTGTTTTRPNALARAAGTNVPITTTNPPADTNGTATNQVNVTNQFFTTNQVNLTNQFFSTNFVSITNRVGLGPNDQAASEFDRALIVQVRQRIFIKDPGISASWGAVNFAANGGNILVSGTMLNAMDKDQLLVLVRNTPGVVGVVDHVLVTPNGNAANANTSTQQFLTPNSDPSRGDAGRFGQAPLRPTTQPSRATIIPTNILFPTGFTNTTSTNVILEGTTGTNVIVVPVETNATSP